MSRPLDDTDRRILSAMQADPRCSMAEIALQVGLSNTPCWRRIKRLETEGVILGHALLLDQNALGLGVNIFAHVKLKQHDEETLNALEAAVQLCDQVVECFSMSGNSDYIMRIVASGIADYEAYLKRVLLHLPGVASINSSFALNCVKMTVSLPLLKGNYPQR